MASGAYPHRGSTIIRWKGGQLIASPERGQKRDHPTKTQKKPHRKEHTTTDGKKKIKGNGK